LTGLRKANLRTKGRMHQQANTRLILKFNRGSYIHLTIAYIDLNVEYILN